MDEHLEIQQLAKQGLSKAEIAQLLGRDQHNVDKYLRAVSRLPVGQILSVGRRVLERFADYIIRGIARGFTNTDGYRGPRVYKREEMMHGHIFNEAVVLEVMHCKENKGGM